MHLFHACIHIVYTYITMMLGFEMKTFSSPSFAVALMQLSVACLLPRSSMQLPLPQAVMDSIKKMDDDWMDFKQTLYDSNGLFAVAQQATTTTSAAPVVAKEQEGDTLTSLLNASPTLERCLNVVPLSFNDSIRGYVGIPDTHTCLNSTVGDAECVNNRDYCSWNSTLRDMGEGYFPRFVAEYQCNGCDPQDEECLNTHNRCSVVPLMLSPKVLKRTASGTWRVVNIPTSLVAYCDCRH